jgi:hypothetical protein
MITLHTTDSDLDALVEALDASRKTSDFVKVPRQAFANLVCDAGVIWEYVQKVNEKIKSKGDA